MSATDYKKTCNKCNAEALKKAYNTPKKVNERYDADHDAKDVFHHSGVDAHDTTHDYWSDHGKYHHPIANEPAPAKKDHADKPMHEVAN